MSIDISIVKDWNTVGILCIIEETDRIINDYVYRSRVFTKLS